MYDHLQLAFYQSQIWAGHYLTSFTYEIFSIYPVWLLGLIFILIGYFRKFKSDEVAREFREKSNLTKKLVFNSLIIFAIGFGAFAILLISIRFS